MPAMRHPRSIMYARVRLLMEGAILLASGLLVLRAWYLQGLVSPCHVKGGSMAETLLGVHREVTCADCGYSFACDAATEPVSCRAVCPNCGYAGNDLEGQSDLAGDGLLINKSAFQLRGPRRWEVVALRSPQDAGQILVKRVVGLPGEAVQVRGGDVYIDGEIQRKTLSEQRAMRVLVYDANYPSRRDPPLPPRWQGEQEDSAWDAAKGRFVHRASAHMDAADSIDWLVYCHWRRVPGQQGQVREEPITDTCGYNQTHPRREEDVHVVTDLAISLRLIMVFGEGLLLIRATDGREEFQVSIDPAANRYQVFQNGRPVPASRGRLPRPLEDMLIEVSLFDQQFLLAFDGRTALTWPYDRTDGREKGDRHRGGDVSPAAVSTGATEPVPLAPPQVVSWWHALTPDPSPGGRWGTSRTASKPTARPLGIGSKGLGVVLRDLRVYRDVYYTHPAGPQRRWALEEPCRLGEDEYFVLGDNSPISEDSRSWPQGPAVDAKSLIGKPLVVLHPARRVDLFGWSFQVPDPTKIRYIR